MEGNRSKSRALLVFGVPCSGKTTFAKKFSEKFGIPYYNLDEIESKYGFNYEKVLIILELIAKTRQTIIIEGGLNTERDRKVIYKILSDNGYENSLIWVQTDLATIRSRLKAKYKSVTKAKSTYDSMVSSLEAPTEAERPIILSGKHTFETQTKHVLAGLADVDKR